MSCNSFGSESSRNIQVITRTPSESGLTRMARNPSEPGKARTGSRRDSNGGGNRQHNIDFGQLNAVANSGSVGRRKLQLLPRSVGVPEELSLEVTVEEPEQLSSMSESQAKAKVEEDVRELFQIRDLTEGVTYFELLPGEHRHLLVDKLVSKIDAKESDVALIEELFVRMVDAGTCDEKTLERGFASTMELLDDISVDVPTAYNVMARLLIATKLSYGAVARLADSIACGGDPPIPPSDQLWGHYRRLHPEESD
jgi:translation initiation factor 4G